MTGTLGSVAAAASPDGLRSGEFLQHRGAVAGDIFAGDQLGLLVDPESGATVLILESGE